MSFIGKIAYLALFPGALSLLLAGAAARGTLEAVSAVLKAPRDTPSASLYSIYERFSAKPARAGFLSSAVLWTAPPARLFAVSWVVCVVTGFLDGDTVLVFFLMLLALAAQLVVPRTSGEPVGVSMENAAVLGCAVALALALAGVSLRTGEVEVASIISWQVRNGFLVASSAGGALARSGSILGLVGALVAGLALMGLRPFRRAGPAGSQGDAREGLSGPPLAALQVSDAAMLIAAPLLVVSLFMAGGASNFYEIAFWALKVLGVVVLCGVIDAVACRFARRRALAFVSGAGCAAALAGFLLVWIGASL